MELERIGLVVGPSGAAVFVTGVWLLPAIGYLQVFPRWTPQIRPSNDTSKPATTGIRLGRVEDLRGRPVRPQVRLNLGAPAPRPALEDVGMVEEAVQ